MQKLSKIKIFLSFIVILLPILFGLAVWNQLPDRLATHWGIDGAANGYNSRAFMVFGLPVSLLALQGLCLFLTFHNPRAAKQSRKMIGLVIWIVPVISLFVQAIIYATALGRDIRLALFTSVPVGVLFLLLGNYLPKTTQNEVIGFRIPWTLANEENWNKTHRLGGKIWVIGGLLMIFTAFLPGEASVVALIAVAAVITVLPVGYSYWLYRKQREA